jgi:hypothetical protein
MFKSDIIDVNGLVNYINDVKPYHSKLLDIVIDYQYDDMMSVNIDDASHSFAIGLCSQWTKNSKNTGWRLADVSDGSLRYKKWRIPTCSFPIHSTSYDKKQPVRSTPTYHHGYDQIKLPSYMLVSSKYIFDKAEIIAAPDVEVTSLNGFDLTPTEDYTFDDQSTISYVEVADPTIYFEYRAIYRFDKDLSNLDNFVYKNGQLLIKNVDYIVNNNTIIINSSDTVVFPLTNKYPDVNASINYKTKEILNLSVLEWCAEEQLDNTFTFTFEDTNSRSYRVPFHDAVRVYVNSVEKFHDVDFTVSTDAITFFEGKEPQLDDEILFDLMNFDRFFIKIDDIWQTYVISYDDITYIETDGTLTYDVYPVDEEFFDTPTPVIKQQIKTEQLTAETRFNPIGSVKIITDTHDQKYYIFEFFTVPRSGTHIEFQIEQYSNYRAWTQTSITETLKIRDRVRFVDKFDVTFADPYDSGFDSLEFSMSDLDSEVLGVSADIKTSRSSIDIIPSSITDGLTIGFGGLDFFNFDDELNFDSHITVLTI